MSFSMSELSNMDLDSIGDLPKIAKVIIIAVVCVAIMAGIFVFLNMPQLDELSKDENTETELKQEFELKQGRATNLNIYKLQLVEIKKTFGTLLHLLPGKTEVPGLLEDISAAGVASGLKFNSFKPQPEKSLEFYAELPIEISVTGNYHQFAEFVSKIASLDRIVTVHDIDIQHSQNSSSTQKDTDKKEQQADVLTMKILAKTYRYEEGNNDFGKDKLQNGAPGMPAAIPPVPAPAAAPAS